MKLQRTAELMDMVGMDDSFLDRYPNELSGGQQQRIGVARAFALDPDIILMDEPFSALDPITRNSLQEELVSLQEKVQKTIVFVTHDMSEAIKIADKICIMDKGEIIQYDTPENILKNPANDFVTEFVGEKRIWESPEYIRAKDITIDDIVTCTGDISLSEAQEKMRKNKVNSLIVKDENTNKMDGILKPKLISKCKDDSIKVEDVMIRDFEYVEPDDSVVEILKVVDDNNISEIPVIDDNDELLGLVTRDTLISTLSEQYLEEEED